MSIQTIDVQGAQGSPYVPGLVVSGDLIFVSGQVPVRDGAVVGTTIEEQVESVLSKIVSILRQAGATLGDVVRCGVFLADLEDLPRLNAVYERAFAARLPTRTTVGVDLPGYRVEIDCILVRPAREDRRPA